MELKEILTDALIYPTQHIKSLVIYMILGIIMGIAVGGTVFGILMGVEFKNLLAAVGSGIIGIIIALIIGFLINGYELDIVKYGIERSDDAPEIDFVRQFINGVKLFALNIVYMIIPIIIASILAVVFQHWLSVLISVIISIIFGLALMMAQCRLAKTQDLGAALSIGEAIGDISRIGIVKLVLFIILILIIGTILFTIVQLIAQWNSMVGGILMGILGVYITFFVSRATGLLYSEV